ncbi:FIMAH domain-containing protein [Paenibacillus sp. GYB003]|uniref:FIMAH domain-containing protein n=1 Tax=Paenibacillus sp. GYB003 TaxID=2994392 RepID=UPI002F96CA39
MMTKFDRQSSARISGRYRRPFIWTLLASLLFDAFAFAVVAFADDARETVSPSATSYAASANLVANPGFEQVSGGKPSDWVMFNTSTYQSVTNTVYSGSYAVKLTNNLVGNGLRSSKIAVKPGIAYKASVYSYNESGGSQLYLEFWDRNNVRIGVKTTGQSIPAAWTKMEASLAAPANAVTATVLLYQNASNKGVAYYDDASLTIEPTSTPFAALTELSRSPGVESGTAGEALLLTNVRPGQFVEYELPVAAAGFYDIRLAGAASPSGGRAHVLLDGEPIGEIDFYGPDGGRTELVVSKPLAAGKRVLKLQGAGKHADSAGYDLLPAQIVLFLDLIAENVQRVEADLDAAQSLLNAANAKLLPGGAPADLYLRARSTELANALQSLRERSRQPDIDYATSAALVAEAGKRIWEIKRFTNFAEVRHAQPGGGFGLATADSMALVYPLDLPCLCRAEPAAVSLAQGEYESIQAVVMPYGEPLAGVNARVAAVSGPNGDAVPASMLRVDVAPLGSVNVKPTGQYSIPASANSPGSYYGWTPDPIRSDLAEVDVPAGTMQPYWIELYASPLLPPGKYRASIAFRANGLPAQSLDLQVDVWPIELDDRPKLATSMTTNPQSFYATYGITDPAEMERMKNVYFDFLETFKIEPDLIYRNTPPTVEELKRIESKWGLRQFNVLYIDPRVGFDLGKPETWQPRIDSLLNTIGAAMVEYEKAGLAHKAYIYGFDETRSEYNRLVKEILRQLKARFPNVPVMSTYLDRTLGAQSGLAGMIDIWVPGVEAIDHTARQTAQERGDLVYWYLHVSVKSPNPNWFNGYLPSDTRVLLGPLSHKLQLDGFLYYNINRWIGRAPMSDGVLSHWDPRTYPNADGDGSLYYPGPEGPLASQRLQNFRDGMEDYNLLEELENEIREAETRGAPGDVLADARVLLGAGAVATDERNFTKDPAAYRQWRDRVADMIVDLSKHTAPERIRKRMDAYEASGELKRPLLSQLDNNLKQAIHHFEQGRTEQAVKSLDDFLKHLSNAGLQSAVGEQAKTQLTADIRRLIAIWQR